MPNATESKVFVGANTRAPPAADPEVRCLFVKLFLIMQRVSPLLMHGMRVVALDDGSKGVESAYRKV